MNKHSSYVLFGQTEPTEICSLLHLISCWKLGRADCSAVASIESRLCHSHASQTSRTLNHRASPRPTGRGFFPAGQGGCTWSSARTRRLHSQGSDGRSPTPWSLLTRAEPQSGNLRTTTHHCSWPNQDLLPGHGHRSAPVTQIWPRSMLSPPLHGGVKVSRDVARATGTLCSLWYGKGRRGRGWEQAGLVSPGSISEINLCRDKSPKIFIWRISCFSVNPTVSPTRVIGFFPPSFLSLALPPHTHKNKLIISS